MTSSSEWRADRDMKTGEHLEESKGPLPLEGCLGDGHSPSRQGSPEAENDTGGPPLGAIFRKQGLRVLRTRNPFKTLFPHLGVRKGLQRQEERIHRGAGASSLLRHPIS